MSTATIDRHVSIVLADGTLVDTLHPLPTTGSGGGGGGGAVTVADGADSAEGFTTDAAVQGDNPGTVSAKLRGLNKSVAAGIPITAAALPLPAGAAQDRTTAAAPGAVELSDGAAFYVGAKTGQLPTALTGSGNLKVALAESTATQPVSGTVTANAGSGTFAMQATAGAPGAVELSDGAAFYVGAKTGQLPAALVNGGLNINVGSLPGTVSTSNSTTTPLAGGAPFTGVGEDVSGYAAVTVSVFTDQISAASGLALQWSSDNSNWDVKQTCSVTAFTMAGGSAPGVVITTPPLAKFFRLVYTNGATLQGVFRAQTIYHAVAPPAFAVSAANQGVRPSGAVPMLWDSANDIYGPMRTFGSQPDNSGGSTAGTVGAVALNASSNPERLRTALGATGTAGVGLLGAGALLWDAVGGATFIRQAGDGSGRAQVVGTAAVGSPPTGNPVSIAGWDGTNKQHLKLNSDGTPAVGGFTVAVNATFTRPANTTTYTANTGVANATSVASQLTFTGAARFSGGSGVILGASLLDEANQTLKGQFELWLFDTTIGTIIADDANWTPANADLANLVGIIPFNTSYVGNNGSGASGNVVFESGLINFPFKCNGSANLFGMLVVRNAYVPVSAEAFICRLLVSCD